MTSVHVRPAGQLEIRAERTNASWQLTKPVSYPARTAGIAGLLAALERLTPATYITARELRQRPKEEEEFGFEAPQVSLIIQDAESRRQILIGNKTAPGDQVFLQVIGLEGIYVVDAELLKLIPTAANDWRSTSPVGLRHPHLQPDYLHQWRESHRIPARLDEPSLAHDATVARARG